MLWMFICLQILASSIVEMASDGAKLSACASMFPGHYADEQNGGSPYVLTVSSSNYYPLANITVTVKSNSVSGFKGFLCQARRELEQYVTYGKLTPAGNVKMANNCEQKASLTHTENSMKSFVSFIWTAPTYDAGDITIVCTIVQDFSTFWTNVTSPKMAFSQTVTKSTRHVSTSTETITTPSSSSPASSTKSTVTPASSSTTKSTVSPASSSSTKSTVRPMSSSSSSKPSESSTATSTPSVKTTNTTTEVSTTDSIASSADILDFPIHGFFTILTLQIALFTS